MTTREKFETLLDRLSEEQLDAEYKRLRQAVAGEEVVRVEPSSPRPDLRGSVKFNISDEEFVNFSMGPWDVERD